MRVLSTLSTLRRMKLAAVRSASSAGVVEVVICLSGIVTMAHMTQLPVYSESRSVSSRVRVSIGTIMRNVSSLSGSASWQTTEATLTNSRAVTAVYVEMVGVGWLWTLL